MSTWRKTRPESDMRAEYHLIFNVEGHHAVSFIGFGSVSIAY